MSDDRQEFEEWATKNGLSTQRDYRFRAQYCYPEAKNAWLGWQAGRARACPDSVQITKGCARFLSGLLADVISREEMYDDSNYTDRLQELDEAIDNARRGGE